MAIEGRSDAKKGGRIKLGMVGGGEGAFIGAVHRIASRLDDHYELVAGALSSTPDKARRSGEALGLAADRIYDDYESMAETEAKRSGGIEAVAIVTPNHMHAGPTYAFLKAGVHVICDKPLTVSLAEAKKMQAAVDKSDRIFALTHNYTAYPLVRRMREMAQGGELGEIRLVQVEYPQDWLTGPSETTGNKQAEWRVDPKRSGAGGALGDIGTHAFNLADYVTGLKLAELAADPDHAALRERRARRPLGEPDRAGQRERAQAQGLRDQGRGPLGAGQPERNAVVAVREVDAHRHPRRAGFGRCGGAGYARAAGSSGRLSRRLCQHLFGGRACDQSGARGEEAAEGRPLPDHRRRRQRPRFHRSRSEIVESQCEMGEAVRRAGSGRRSPEAVRLGAQDGAAQKQRRRPRAAGEVLRVRQTRRRPATS
jgi:predicted dehydrogenase